MEKKYRWIVVAIIAAIVMGVVAVAALGGLRPRPETAPETATSNPKIVRLRKVETKGIVVDDMKLAANTCKPRVLDTDAGLVLPDRNCTPGAIDPRVTQDNIAQTICKSGYTAGKDVRPPTSATNKAKESSLAAYGIKAANTVEYDHLISLQLGGASSTSNLWPEPNKASAKSTTNPKDDVENKLAAAVCNGLISLNSAQQSIAIDWVHALAANGIEVKDVKDPATGKTSKQLCSPTKCVPATKVPTETD